MLRDACALILIGLVQLQFALCQEIPHIACPEYFSYVQLGGVNYGKLTLPAKSGSSKIKVELSQSGDVDVDKYHIMVLDSEETFSQRIQQGKPIFYYLAIPPGDALPKLILIDINDDVICSASAYPAPSTLIAIQIQAVVVPKTDPQMRSSVIGNNGHSLFQTNETSSWPEVSMSYNGYTCGREGISGVVPFIAGGTYLTRGQFPWLTAILQKNPPNLKFICGGSLISSRTVVSAAHCVRALREDQIVIHSGRHHLLNNREPGIEQHEIEKLLIHPDYNSWSPDADLALLQTKTTVEFSQYIQPICLWNESDDEDRIAGQMGTVAGWGGEDGPNVSQRPKKATARIVSRADCVHRSDDFQQLTSARTLCAGNLDGTGPCMGDSGGGLMLERNGRWFLRAIVSVGPTIAGKCNLADYVIYCDVAKHKKWMVDNALA